MNNKVVTFGEIMLRLATPSYERLSKCNKLLATYGGGECNVAISLANYGIPSSFITRLPDNEIGESCRQNLNNAGVETKHIQFGGARMGIYYLETGAVSRGSKVVYDRTNSAFTQIEPGSVDWEEALDGAGWFHWTGITPAVSEKAAAVCLEAIKMANKLGITVSTDVNYREKLWTYGKVANDIMPELVEGCDIIQASARDAVLALNVDPKELDINKDIPKEDLFVEAAVKIMEQYPRCKKVITTFRGTNSANHNSLTGVLFDGKQLFQGPIHEITHITDRVGGGDAFMGGLIYGLTTYKDDLQKALNFAVAASSLKHTVNGDYNRSSVEEVQKLMDGNTSGRVSW